MSYLRSQQSAYSAAHPHRVGLGAFHYAVCRFTPSLQRGYSANPRAGSYPTQWRRVESNHRPQGYEPCELPNCSTPLCQNILAGCSVACQAEGQGFEPWVHRYYARRFSKPVHSASLSTFRSGRRTRASMNVTRPRQALCEQSTAAPSTGFEPVAFPLGGERSIPLSYEGFIALSVSKNPRLQ